MRDFISASRRAAEKAEHKINDRVLLRVRESKAQAAFETRDKEADFTIHWNILAK